MFHKPTKYRTFQFSRFLSTLLITVLLFGFQPVQTTQAATITVDTLVDGNDFSCSDGDCTLREAIYSASADDTVDVSLSGTLNLSLGQLVIDKNLTITGPGAGNLSISAASSSRAFYINSGVTVTISGVTITNGSVDYGGGIYNTGTLTIENSTVSGNTASTNGGGIFTTGSLTVDNCTIHSNGASNHGGGISTEGNVSIQNGSVIGGFGTGNTADFFGGGIFIASGTTTIDASTVSYNDAINGCGVYNLAAGTLMVQNGSYISGNGACINGGGIYNKGNSTIDNSTISDNDGGYGGGVFNESTLHVQNGSTIGGFGAGNSGNFGGGIYNFSGTATVDSSTISENSVTSEGGGIFIQSGTLTVDSSSVNTNSASTEGGGIFNEATLFVQDSSTVNSNSAINGGGIFNHDVSASATVSASEVNSNIGTLNGGGIYNEAGINIQNGSTVDGNNANEGGGIYNASGITTVDDSSVSSNTASADGGGILNFSGTTTVDGSTINNNTGDYGGGIRNRGTLNIQNGSTIGENGAGNTAATNGGGIFSSSGTTTVVASTVSSNSAADYGGGIFTSSALLIDSSTIDGNSGVEGGGGIYNSVSTTTVNSSTFSGNSAVEHGGGIYNYDGTITLQHSTVADNTADSNNDSSGEGGGIYNFQFMNLTTINFENTIIIGNYDLSGTGAEDCYNNGGTLASQDYNLTGIGTGCSISGTNDQTSADAMLLPLGDNGGDTETHALDSGSPAINQIPNGINGCGTTYTTDQRGEPRPYHTGGLCDIGSYEKPFPEMDVQGNGQSISDGDSTPSSLDDTDFGFVAVDAGIVAHIFTIENTGGGDLNLTDSPEVTISGVDANDFTVTSQPTSPVAANGGTTTFEVTFDPSAAGLREAQVNIANDDSDENPYTFDIQGTGTVPEIILLGNNQSITDGDSTPSLADHTDFGGTKIATGTIIRTFTIENSGGANLNLTDSPHVVVSGTHAADFSIISQPTSPVVFGGGKTTFQVKFDPSDTGLRGAIISIENNDFDENPFTFSIQGMGNITFSDVPESYWAYDWIEGIAAAGLTSGYPDGTYRPENPVSRAEMAVFLLNGMGISAPPIDGSHPFSDIAGHWAEAYIEELYDQGITGGYPDSTYRPENQVIRAEMAVFLLKGISVTPQPMNGSHPFTDIAGHWAEIFIEELYDQGITGGYPDGTYRPENQVTRAEMAVFLVNTFGIPLP